MKRILVLGLIVLCMAVATTAFGASARWNALGNEHRFMIDTSNYGPYPARVLMFGDAVWLIPRAEFGNNDISAGILMNVKPNMLGAFHFGMASAGTTKLSSALKAYEGSNDRLAGLQVRTFPDLFWGMKMGKTSIAARVALAMDSSGAENISTSANSSDIYLGVTMPTPCGGDIDLGLNAGIQSFKDEASGKVVEGSGNGIAFDARFNKPMGTKYTLVPVLNVKLGADPTDKDTVEVSSLGGDAGVGVRAMYDKKMVIIGAVVAYNSVTKTPKGKAETTTTTIAPRVVAGAEIPVTKWLIVRGGANVELASTSNGTSSMDVRYYYNSGIRVMYGGFILDLILARDLFYRGPYFISGANKDSVNLASNICITYKY